ncbi:MAG: ankyrin repeat domain-containing protein [Chloroflexota bacterium]|nr:ankyrin repeat domain-containing protein [Chloroflexota bacterium]MDE2938062.1 ankyrin repeat domain-containing protein [Chloroflexota bacterium]
MRYNDYKFDLAVALRMGSVTIYDSRAPSSFRQLSVLDPAAIGKAMREAAFPRLPFVDLPTPAATGSNLPAGPGLAEAAGASSVGNLYRTAALVTAISDGYEARFLGTSPTADFFGPSEYIAFHPMLSSRHPYGSLENPPKPEHTLLIAPWQDPEMLGQAVLNVFAMAGPPVNKGMLSVFDPPTPKRRTVLHRAATGEPGEDLPARKPRNVNPVDTAGVTPLMLVAKAGEQETAFRLLDWGADQDLRDRLGLSALHHAAAGGHAAVIGVLMESGADPDQPDHYGRTPLHLAAARGHAPAVARLLAGRASPNAQDRLYSSTPLHLAVRGNHRTLLPLLTGAGADIDSANEAGRTALHVAAAYGYRQLVRDLIATGADVNRQDQRGEAPLHRSTFYQHLECVATLLEAGADPGTSDYQGTTPLHVAARMNRGRAIHLLLNAGADVGAINQEGLTSLDLAMVNLHEVVNRWQSHLEGTVGTGWEHNSEAVEILLEHGANLDPLRIPVGDRHVLWPHLTPSDLLLPTGDIDYAKLPGLPESMKKRLPKKDRWNHSPLNTVVTLNSLLHDAVNKGMPQLVKTLLKYGASPDTAVRINFPPLHLAAGTGNRELVDILLQYGADLETPWTNAPDGRYDPLRNNWERLKREFPHLEYDKRMGRVFGNMGTALDEATNRGQVEMVRHLLEWGAVPLPDLTRIPRNWGIPHDTYMEIMNRGLSHLAPEVPDTYERLLLRHLFFYNAPSELLEAMTEVFRDFGLIP